jgi:phosphoethanolamine N-methyltransferase
MGEEHPHDYDTAMLEMLDIIWGDGFMSPGGPQAVRETLEGIDLRGKSVLDIGCESAGWTRSWCRWAPVK